MGQANVRSQWWSAAAEATKTTTASASQTRPRVKMEPGCSGSMALLVKAMSRPTTVSDSAKMASWRSKPYQRPWPSRAASVPTRAGSRRSVLMAQPP